MCAMWTILDSGTKAPRRALLPKLLTTMLICTGGSLSGCVLPEDIAIDDDVETSVITEQVTWSGHDYLFVNTAKTWNAAKTHCTYVDNGSAGYHLVIINDEDEEMFLDAAETARGLSNWWIGLSDQETEDSWVWVNSAPLIGYINGLSDNTSQKDCAVDRAGGTNSWGAQSCGSSYNFICERDSILTTNKGSFSYSRTNTNNATTNTHTHSVYRLAGSVLTVGTCGVPGASVTSGDTWLRIKNSSGVEVGNNNDAGEACGTGSNLSIIAATTGNYVIHAGCNGTTACAGTVTFN